MPAWIGCRWGIGVGMKALAADSTVLAVPGCGDRCEGVGGAAVQAGRWQQDRVKGWMGETSTERGLGQHSKSC
jgi:hypothetical protein